MAEFDRQKSLKEHFNGFWSGILSRSGICNDDIDLYDCMTLADFIELKRALSEINNIITLKLTSRASFATPPKALHDMRLLLLNRF